MKKPQQQQVPSRYLMAFSQPLNESKQDYMKNQFFSFEDVEPQCNSRIPSFNNSNLLNNQNNSMNFDIMPPPNLKKINPMNKSAQKPTLNNTPNTMNQINQMRNSNTNPAVARNTNEQQVRMMSVGNFNNNYFENYN